MPALLSHRERIGGVLALAGAAVVVAAVTLTPAYQVPEPDRTLWALTPSDIRLRILAPLLVLVGLPLVGSIWLLVSSRRSGFPSGVLLGVGLLGLGHLARLAGLQSALPQEAYPLAWGTVFLLGGMVLILAAGALAASIHIDPWMTIGIPLAVTTPTTVAVMASVAQVDLDAVVVPLFGAVAVGVFLLGTVALWRVAISQAAGGWLALLGMMGFALAVFLPMAGFANGPDQIRSYGLLDLRAPASFLLVSAALPATVVGTTALGSILIAGRERAALGGGLVLAAALFALPLFWAIGARLEFMRAGFWVGFTAGVVAVGAAFVALARPDGNTAPGGDPPPAPA